MEDATTAASPEGNAEQAGHSQLAHECSCQTSQERGRPLALNNAEPGKGSTLGKKQHPHQASLCPGAAKSLALLAPFTLLIAFLRSHQGEDPSSYGGTQPQIQSISFDLL